MQRALLRIWSLPWPDGVRRTLRPFATAWWVQRLVFPRFLVGVVGLIENDREEYLLLRHTYRGDYPWGLPTGWMERREQPVEGLAREVREETGFEVGELRLWQAYTEPERGHLNIVFRGRYRGGSFVPSAEVCEARFFPVDGLPRQLLPDQRRLLEACQEEVQH